MNTTRVPAGLLSAVKSDLRPVRPLATPARRALSLLPLGLALLVGMPAFWAWRSHLPAPPWPSRGLSLLEVTLSLLILAAAFREAIPGRELPKQTLIVLTCLCCACFFSVNPAMPALHAVPLETTLRWMRECIVMATTFSIPALAVPAWLVGRALPTRPGLAGALCGLGVGLMVDAGLRLLCWDGEYSHVVLAHGGAIALLISLGALSAIWVERIKARELERR